MTFVRTGVSHRMCVAIESTSHTEVVVSLRHSQLIKNPIPSLSDARIACEMEGNRQDFSHCNTNVKSRLGRSAASREWGA